MTHIAAATVAAARAAAAECRAGSSGRRRRWRLLPFGIRDSVLPWNKLRCCPYIGGARTPKKAANCICRDRRMQHILEPIVRQALGITMAGLKQTKGERVAFTVHNA